MKHRLASPEPPSRAPLHVRVRETIRRDVKDGRLLDANGRLLTEAELVKHFGVSRVTIRNAIRPLVDEGMFDRSPGRGTFLRTNQPENWVGRLMGFSETIRDAGYEPGARVLQTGAVEAPEAAVRQLLRASTVWQLKRVRLADETPIAIEHAFYPIEIGRELEPRDLTSIVMYRVFDDELKLDIKDAHQTVSATRADNSSAGLLGIEVGHPLLAMQRLTTSATGQPLELLRSLYLPDYFQFTIRLTRSPAANEGAS